MFTWSLPLLSPVFSTLHDVEGTEGSSMQPWLGLVCLSFQCPAGCVYKDRLQRPELTQLRQSGLYISGSQESGQGHFPSPAHHTGYSVSSSAYLLLFPVRSSCASAGHCLPVRSTVVPWPAYLVLVPLYAEATQRSGYCCYRQGAKQQGHSAGLMILAYAGSCKFLFHGSNRYENIGSHTGNPSGCHELR